MPCTSIGFVRLLHPPWTGVRSTNSGKSIGFAGLSHPLFRTNHTKKGCAYTSINKISMNNKEKRKFLLRKYIKEVEQLHLVFSDGYDDMGKGSFICPLCRRIFNIGQLGEQFNSYITLEHVPPENLGGKPLVLTCKDCNSTCGHDLDVYLRNEIEHLERAYFNGSKGHSSKYSYGGFEVNAITNEDKDGTINIRIERKRNSPIVFDKFSESVYKSANDLHIDGHLILGDHRRNVKMADVAKLKSAYLYAFYKLGYKYIMYTKLDTIRKQIQHPHDDICPLYYILNSDFIDENKQDDVYIATIDGEKVLAVLLTLKRPESDQSHRFTTILPLPQGNDLDLYNRLCAIHKDKSSIEIQFIGIERMG